MKNIIFLFLISIASCTANKKDKIWIPRENIKSILDSFVNVVDDENLVYEIYIDKLNQDKYNLYIYGGRESLQKDPNSSLQTEIKGLTFNIYSGVEHFFKTDNETVRFEDKFKDPLPTGSFFIIKDSCNYLEVFYTDWIIPYYPHFVKALKNPL